MAGLILVDTDVLIDASRGVNNAITFLEAIEKESTLAVSTVTEMELIVGCRNKTELRELDKFLARFEILALDTQVSETASELLRRYRLSHGLLIPDALIAATGISHQIPLATKNHSDYRFIDNLQLLAYKTG